jgi:hypothetical protein
VNLVRLERHQNPRPPHVGLRQNSVFDSGYQNIGQVAYLYVDDNRDLQFVDVVTSGFLGLGKTHHLVPVEAITDEAPGSVTLGVDQGIVESAPSLSNPLAVPNDNLQRAVREHYGYG